MKVTRVFNKSGTDFDSLVSMIIENELVKLANQKYNSGKDIAADNKEEK